MNIAEVSKVYPHTDKFRFFVTAADNSKGYEYTVKKSAIISRARLIKRLKTDGFKVYL